MKNVIGKEMIPIIDTTQLKTELFSKGAMPISTFTANAHEYFHINRVEDYFKMVSFPLPSDLIPRRITVYSFFFLTKGISSRSSGLDSYDFGENTFFFTPAHQITTHKFIRKDVEGFYCHFKIDFLTENFNYRNFFKEFPFLELNSYPLVKINEQTKSYIIPILERLTIEYKSGEKCRKEVLKSYLLTLFTELVPFYEKSKKNSTNAAGQITEQYKKALTLHINRKNKITDYAELLNISPNHLNKCVKKALGKSAHDLLNEMLLLEAKVLLKQTNLNITEISHKIGKNEISDFARFFKSQTGMRPSEYRETV